MLLAWKIDQWLWKLVLAALPEEGIETYAGTGGGRGCGIADAYLCCVSSPDESLIVSTRYPRLARVSTDSVIVCIDHSISMIIQLPLVQSVSSW